ncbi:MAG TPA: hypothetical protein VKB93_24700, partial [Thermoanaerobaculia bacterium]|nr:hypothetical protein [Thermoanaerobaculia bacterium]
MKRAVLAAAIVLFAVVSAPRLRFDHLPRAVLPELRVEVSLGDENTDRWIVPIESSIRSLGDVTATRAELSTGGARFTVRFRNGIDANVKAARLSSELAPLRAKLPRDGRMTVWPSTQAGDRPSLIVALTEGEARAKRVAEEVRAARGVRSVELFGLEQPVIDVRLRRGVDAAVVRAAIDAALAPRPLAKTVVVAPSARRIEDVPVGAVRLGAIAEVRPRIAEAESLARVNGRPAILMAIRRDDDASLFAFESSVHERLQGNELYNEAAELRAMLLRAAIAALVASLLLALWGWELALW